jgi:uncharacterized membrane protein
VLIPLLLFYLLFSELLDLVIALAIPITGLLPAGFTKIIDHPLLLASVTIIVCAFVCGLALRSSMLKSLGAHFENNMLYRLPLYRAVKRLSQGVLGVKGEDVFSCGFVELSPGIRELVYIVEDEGNDYVTVMVPLAPTGFNGPLKIIEANRVIRIDASVGKASVPISEWGVGLQKLADGQLEKSNNNQPLE